MSDSTLTLTPDEQLRRQIIGAVQEIDCRPISHLMDLLGQVRPSAVYPIANPGIY